MPFIAPHTEESVGPWGYAWKSLCHHACRATGESGDAVFFETSREDGGYLLLIADAAGHGPKAAELVGLTRYLLEQEGRLRNATPVQLLRYLHGLLSPRFSEEPELEAAFVCAAAVLLENAGAAWHAGNAGLPAPYVRYGTSDWYPLPNLVGAPLGMPHFPEHGPGSHAADATKMPGVFVCTDGVTDSGKSVGGASFGNSRLPDVLKDGHTASPEVLVARLFAELQKHAGQPWPEDDTTALVVSLTYVTQRR